MTQKRVLGVDPGSRVTGYGIVEEEEGKLHAVTYGAISLFSEKSFPARLKKLYQELEILIEQYKPTECAIETVFFAKNVSSSLKLGQARGTVLTVCANYNVEVSEYSPTQIKKAIIGYGRSSKEQLQKMLYLMLGVKDLAHYKLDVSDALSIAICHLNSIRFNEVREKYDRATQR
ncbi:MAG: crossover junction endodeoxyribonuclease RuvC [Deltaproteobacteria bacterium GWA2_38_16]|nr:MAG: crossover junction endodeoxyribonuclease RuvC [Deltaproteobacteria bacterium GWA2_38_16]OGQ02140.1 MAG: crossover junction endodeoxyribonuclease RuvC [Deltaproteobacteria bacterium RIFCSPHIGHO2_02_FULL_38_15]OGQ34192.1 MAG: crossover junction endodeoxyribonuclease RuvC [Deltaproteobacteria bacterium RIFCSPLOWO2_01_FULL_38_9]OGQ60570.1 MAG: crossover junction endodeoxyribonuclease RuvC [Deltaproteobacteria bacterium RIFCSPLOWO2_12_FULL_38_8]